jgi:hypothetical protein
LESWAGVRKIGVTTLGVEALGIAKVGIVLSASYHVG